MPTSLSHSGSSPRAGPDQVSLLSTTGHKGGNTEFMQPECPSKTTTLQMSAPDLLSRLSKELPDVSLAKEHRPNESAQGTIYC